MSFFDDLGKTITSTSQEVVKKARSLAEQNSLRMQLKEQEARRNKAFERIGRLYFGKLADAGAADLPEDIVEECAIIKDAAASIENLNIRLNELKGYGTCVSCGAQMDAEDVFCAKCGTKG